MKRKDKEKGKMEKGRRDEEIEQNHQNKCSERKIGC